jgi:hypothetical protein
MSLHPGRGRRAIGSARAERGSRWHGEEAARRQRRGTGHAARRQTEVEESAYAVASSAKWSAGEHPEGLIAVAGAIALLTIAGATLAARAAATGIVGAAVSARVGATAVSASSAAAVVCKHAIHGGHAERAAIGAEYAAAAGGGEQQHRTCGERAAVKSGFDVMNAHVRDARCACSRTEQSTLAAYRADHTRIIDRREAETFA